MEKNIYDEKVLKPKSGMLFLFLMIFGFVGSIILFIVAFACFTKTTGAGETETTVITNILFAPFITISVLYFCFGWTFVLGFRVVKPNEALVVTLFGKYTGTIKKEGFFFINPFSSSVNPGCSKQIARTNLARSIQNKEEPSPDSIYSRYLSLKVMTLVNAKQKINDELGNPIEVGIVVIWKIVNTAKACFNVDNYKEFISTQADSSLRDVVRTYPYDLSSDGDEKCLRASSQEVALKIKDELQKRVEVAGIEILETRITHLAYATEIAAAMLQRQQATAIIEARQKIVEGAVGMVQMALDKLSKDKICELDDERKAQMVSNLLVVLCGNKDAQPIVNSGSIY